MNSPQFEKRGKNRGDRKTSETVETETTVLKKHAFWYEATGIKDELIVALEQSKKILSSIEKVEENLEFIKFVSKEDEELNEYAKKVILSSGSALLLAFYSAYYEIEISDSFSITGQIEDDGNISKIGGVKEKIIKAIRDKKIKNLILPQENHEKALKILDKYYKKYSVSEKLNLYPVSH
ncbi:14264_t:CDS:2 [Funneliformis geosporum]|uniref:17835_t:CDS:1 n=1 Tax=Funneliformis geosporum TaxID=1117311 RepID=A0A9W4SBI7_9GLOM|nr:14264_t:CDS:2 [Funneliformis geosporum]CAI2162572.1 17835_t:CDS:2 [Funneliformis geosporum]